MDMKALRRTFLNGIFNENPTFRLVLGMCPTLAITYQATNGIGMGLATTFVLVFSNLVISLLRKRDPGEGPHTGVHRHHRHVRDGGWRWCCTRSCRRCTTTLGVFIPLIVVNCIIFARAEAFAFKNPPLASAVDGLGMGLGFTLAITLLSCIRELLGSGTVFGARVMPGWFEPMAMAVQPAGGFILLGLTMAAVAGIAGAAAEREGGRGMDLILIFVGAVLVNNFVMNKFMGCCPFLGVSKKTETAFGMGWR